MAAWIKRIIEWSKRTDSLIDKYQYSLGLFVLVLAGFCLQLPLILNIIIQVVFLICSIHLIYQYCRGGHYFLAMLPLGLIVCVGLVDDVYFHIIFSN